jgi:hypothetical protein
LSGRVRPAQDDFVTPVVRESHWETAEACGDKVRRNGNLLAPLVLLEV